jgi:hypothetical protein
MLVTFIVSLTMNATSLAMNATSPTMNATSPTMNATSPTMNATSLAMNATSLAMNATSPTMNVVSLIKAFVGQAVRVKAVRKASRNQLAMSNEQWEDFRRESVTKGERC